MATSITHEDVKPRVGIPSATVAYDSEIDTVCTAVGLGVDAYVASAYLTSDAAVVKEAAIIIASGHTALSMAKRPGWGESISSAGVAVGALDASGAESLIKLGWDMLRPFTDSGNADELAKQAESVLRKALAEARDDDAVAQADAELLKAQNEAARLGAEKLLIDAQELKIDAETATEAEKPAKVVADAALATALAAQADAVAAVHTQRAARLEAENTLTDVPQESHEPSEAPTFDPDAENWAF